MLAQGTLVEVPILVAVPCGGMTCTVLKRPRETPWTIRWGTLLNFAINPPFPGITPTTKQHSRQHRHRDLSAIAEMPTSLLERRVHAPVPY